MARPALVIGVGGTGQWVLTHLKKDLLEIGRGEMPEGVKLLCFDTVKHPSAIAGDDRQKEETKTGEKREKRVGAVQLENKTEYIHIGADLKPVVDKINVGGLPHLNWLNGNKVLTSLNRAALNCDDGAGAIRQLGRLCLVKDVQSGAASKIRANIGAAMRSINTANVTVENRMEIIIIGSLAGGTGSGILVDIALLCRNQAPASFAGNIIVSGFVVTPRQFTVAGGASADRRMLAASFAAWRELDRFLISNNQYGSNTVEYSTINEELNISSGDRLFDFTYIIDPQREKNTIPAAQREKGGLFASLADSISQILDDKAGADYSARVINLGKTYLANSGTVLHSTIGAYTIKTPIYYEQATMTQESAQRGMEDFLAPKDSMIISELLENQNGEVGAEEVGQGGALVFFKHDSKPFGGKELANAPLCKLIGTIWANKVKENKAIATKDASSHMPEHSNAMDVGDILKSEWTHSLLKDVPYSRNFDGRDPNSEREKQRIKSEISKSRLKHLGNPDKEGDTRGLLGESLTKCQFEQVRLFGYFLRAYCEEILNGTSANVVTAKSGKLGYLIGVHKGISDGFDYYLDYLNELVEIRNTEMNKQGKAKAISERAYQQFVSNPHKKSLFAPGGIHPDSFLLQGKYLEAEKRWDDVAKERILIEYLQRTATEMKAVLESAFNDLLSWKDQLIALYSRVIKEKDNIAANQYSDETQAAVRKIVNQEVLTNTEVNHRKLLESLNWSANLDTYEELLPDNSKVERIRGINFLLDAIEDSKVSHFNNDGREDSMESNFKAWDELAGRPFEILLEENPPTPLATILMSSSETDTGRELGELLDAKAEPFYAPTDGGKGPRHDPPMSALVRVYQPGESMNYFQEALETISAKDARLRDHISLSDSKDQFKLTYVRFDDCITSRDFEIWQLCKDAYLHYATNPAANEKPEDFHTFPLEINACRYEDKIMNELRRGYRILDARVVALLEDNQRLELFFRALAFGFIRKETDPDTQQEYWYYQIPGSEKIHLTKLEGSVGQIVETDYFVLLNQFCIEGKDVRNNYSGHYAYAISYEDLHTAFLKKLRELDDVEEFRQLCQEQIDSGVVADLRKKIKHMRSRTKTEQARQLIAVAEEDLADLIETIYKFAIRSGR